MGKVKQPEEVRIFAGVMYRDEGALQGVIDELEARLGKVYLRSPVFDFNFTDYYEEEMGTGLEKVFIGFKEPISPDELAGVKTFTNLLEERLTIKVKGTLKRRVNIDPGYIDRNKVVLASTKNRSQRIYLRDGIYAEVTLIFKGKICEPLPWTYPDFKTSLACSFFLSLRGL